MQQEARDFVGFAHNPSFSNPVLNALLEKRAANAVAQGFIGLSQVQVFDIAANAAGLYAREQSWMAVEHLCALALAQALDIADKRSDISTN